MSKFTMIDMLTQRWEQQDKPDLGVAPWRSPDGVWMVEIGFADGSKVPIDLADTERFIQLVKREIATVRQHQTQDRQVQKQAVANLVALGQLLRAVALRTAERQRMERIR